MADYPYVECETHAREPGYVACLCVIAGSKVALVELATTQRIGILLCEACERTPPPMDDMRLVCAHCARLSGWIPNSTAN
jgi:hypothetical protein